VGWTTVALFGNRALTWIVTVVVARILAPAQFGLVGLAWIVYGAALLFRDQTISGVVIHSDDTQDSRNRVFWLTLIASSVLGRGVVCLSPLVRNWTGEDSLPVLALLAAAFVVSAFGVVPGAMLQRRLQFRRVSLAEIAATLVFTVIAVPATVVMGVVGIGVAQFAGATIGVIVVVTAIPFRPSRPSTTLRLRGIASYGLATLALSVAAFGYTNIDTVVVAATYGRATLGQYVLAFNLAYVGSLTITMVMSRVAFPAFRTIVGDHARLRSLFLRALLATAVITAPIVVGLALVGPEVVDAVFGPRYSGTSGPLRWLALYGGAASISAVGVSYLRAVGRIPVALTVLALQYAIAVAGIVVLLAPYGTPGVAMAVTMGAVIGALVLTGYCLRALAIRLFELRRGLAGTAVGAVLMIIVATIGEHFGGAIGLIIGFSAGLAAYAIAASFALRRLMSAGPAHVGAT
jgi:PST family polysaccharide transporter